MVVLPTEASGDRKVDSVRSRDVANPQHLAVFFQPIIRIEGDAWTAQGAEGLVRCRQGWFADADSLFAYVRERHLESSMDCACIAAIMRESGVVPAECRLSINLHAVTLANTPAVMDYLVSAAREKSLGLDRLVIEIVEHGCGWEPARFKAALHRVRDNGISIAVDDLGSGQSNYRKLLECRPDYIKLDRHFVAGCDGDKYRQAILESLASLAARVGGRIVAEGVERIEELCTLQRNGIDLVQGFLFSKPLSCREIGQSGILNTRNAPLPRRSGTGDLSMQKRVLLVDDTETVLLFEKTMLQSAGFELRVARNGNQALAEVKKAKPHLILLDIVMPELDGIETCRRLKSDPETQQIPVVMVTTKGEPDMLERAFQAGCDDYITKPLNKIELLSKVSTFVG